MSFSDPRWLWMLAALPLLLALEWGAARRAELALRRLVGARPAHPLLVQRRNGERRAGAVLRLGALAFFALGAAGPEWGREVVPRAATGSDVVLLLDVSASMDTRDVPPSRLEEARREALAVLERLEGSRVGAVAFAGDAVRLCPLTLDRAAVRLTLESLSSRTVSQPGTDLGRGLRMAARVLPGGRREEQAVVLWTDGEDLEQGARSAIEVLASAGVRVFAVGVGTRTGDAVPVLDDEGRAVDIKRDESGTAVRSRLDEDLLRTLARRTRGAYFSASSAGGELTRLLATLGTLGRSARGKRLVERPVAQFPWCALAAALLLAAELARAHRRREGAAAEAALHSERGAAAAALLLALLAAPPAEAQSAWARGDREFRAGHWAAAESLYALRLRRGGPDEVRVNRATALARRGGPERAAVDLARLAAADTRAGRAAGYNLGTLLGEGRDYENALRELRRSLERDPEDQDARWNYEFLLLRKRERERGRGPSPAPSPTSSPGVPTPQGGAPQPGAPRPGPSAPPPGAGPSLPAPSPGSLAGGMDRAQAERLLGALQELERLERQRMRQAGPVSERPGRDW